ncbi:hypothetical protein BDZ91DRAFT_741854 [Kalaharituber pfeilii]|nr:hypothetical protein BDZ91DRAFT_741854 [Kalaharituber pfeilii]
MLSLVLLSFCDNFIIADRCVDIEIVREKPVLGRCKRAWGYSRGEGEEGEGATEGKRRRERKRGRGRRRGI